MVRAIRPEVGRPVLALVVLCSSLCGLAAPAQAEDAGLDPGPQPVQLGPRPYYLVDALPPGPLKRRLRHCADGPFERRLFSIAHRGAPLQFPEHTRESYIAAARMGAGIIECDVTFTRDLELVCRHDQADLHSSTDILRTALASHCVQPFRPAEDSRPATAECRTSELTLAQFRRLRGRMPAVNPAARDLEDYLAPPPVWRTGLYAGQGGTLLSHAESIELFKSLGVHFMPELKPPRVDMPFRGFTRAQYAQKLIDEYKQAGVPPEQIWPQSFDLRDVVYWIEHEPEFGRQAVFLDGRYREAGFDPSDPESLSPDMQALADMGVRYIAPPVWVLLQIEKGQVVPSAYARAAVRAGLRLITWTLERSGPLRDGGGWYFQSVSELIDSDGDLYTVLDVLAREVGVEGVFSDWPATVSYYANCMGLR